MTAETMLREALQRLLNAVLDPVIGGVHTEERNKALAYAVQVLEATSSLTVTSHGGKLSPSSKEMAMDTKQNAAPMYRIIFRDAAGAWNVVINSDCATFTQARTLLSDRVANGDAFPGEAIWPSRDCDEIPRRA